MEAVETSGGFIDNRPIPLWFTTISDSVGGFEAQEDNAVPVKFQIEMKSA